MKLILEIDIRQKGAKSFLEFLKTLPFVKFLSVKSNGEILNNTTKQAMNDVLAGRVTKIKRSSNSIVSDILNDTDV